LSEAHEQGLAKESEAREQGLAKESEARELAFLNFRSAMEKRMSDVEQDKAASVKKPRRAAHNSPTPAKTKNVVWNNLHSSCGWKKTVKGKTNGNHGFSSAGEALLDMERFYANALIVVLTGCSARG